jgi:hypothetical protein
LQYDSSAEYPWRNPSDALQVDAREQDQQPVVSHSTSDAPNPSLEESVVPLPQWESQDNHLGVAQSIAPQRSKGSMQDSNSSNTTQSKVPVVRRDTWESGTLLRFRAYHYFDYIAETSTGGYVLRA